MFVVLLAGLPGCLQFGDDELSVQIWNNSDSSFRATLTVEYVVDGDVRINASRDVSVPPHQDVTFFHRYDLDQEGEVRLTAHLSNGTTLRRSWLEWTPGQDYDVFYLKVTNHDAAFGAAIT